MVLHIESNEAERLARRLAEITGRSVADAVIDALRRTVRVEAAVTSDAELLLREVAEIQSFLAALPDRDTRGVEEILG